MFSIVLTLIRSGLFFDFHRQHIDDSIQSVIITIIFYFLFSLFCFSTATLMAFKLVDTSTEKLIINISYTLLLALNIIFPKVLIGKLFLQNTIQN